jgi:glycosyltransferase involved in cell wall biosynthesis
VLTVVNVGYPFAPCGPNAVGGAEQVLSAIDAALVNAGHRSIVIAPEGSECRGELWTVPAAPGRIDTAAFYAWHDVYRAYLHRLTSDERVDLIHFHGGDFSDYLPDAADVPMLVTLHLWPTAYPARIFSWKRPNVHLQCVSEAQRRACLDSSSLPVIRNGVDLEELSPVDSPDGFVLALGRICPEKAFHVAVDAAHAAGIPLFIGGTVFPFEAHQTYFDQVLAPRLDGTARFLGALDRIAKRRLLPAARCLVLPSAVRETSSLAAMEALACGTPVVAMRSPALEQLIDHGHTGLLVDSPAEMADAFQAVDRIDRAECRRTAERLCSAAEMTRSYLRCYEDLVTQTACS